MSYMGLSDSKVYGCWGVGDFNWRERA